MAIKTMNTELSELKKQIKELRRLFDTPGGLWRGSNGGVAPLEQTIQARFASLQFGVAAIRSYKRRNHACFEEMLVSYHKLRATMGQLAQDFILTCMAFVALVRIDASHHPLFFAHYENNFSEALGRMRQELTNNDDVTWEETWLPKLLQRMDEYPAPWPSREKILLGLSSLTERAIVQLCSRLFQNVLDIWDRTHGFLLPWTRRIFEVFAYEMVTAFDNKRYQLTHLFDR